MLEKQIHLLDLWMLMQFTITAVASSQWAVWYTHEQLCVFKSSSVDFNCTYNYPAEISVKKVLWFKPGPQPNEKIYVYHTVPEKVNTSYRGRAEFANKDKNCTLRLHNVSESDTGKYIFRFKTDSVSWTGINGTYLNVAVPPFRVKVTSVRTDSFIQEGDAVNLTCNAGACTPSDVQITWFKNRVPLLQVKSDTLRFNSVLPSDSGYYSCGLNNDSSTAPETLLDVKKPGHSLFLPVGLGAVLFGLIVAAVLFYIFKRKKRSSSMKESTEVLSKADQSPALEADQDSGFEPNGHMPVASASEGIYDNLAADEPQLTYAAIRFQQTTSDRPTQTTTEDISVIYSTIRRYRGNNTQNEN